MHPSTETACGITAEGNRPVWDVQVFHPFLECQAVVFGRVAARSHAFASTSASGGAPVVIGSAAGPTAQAVIPRARGELVERVSNILAGRAAESGGGVIATFEELRRAGTAAVDPAIWLELNAATELRQARMLWVVGESLTTQQEILVPASSVFLHHRPPEGCSEMLRAGSAGVSAHVSWQAAVRHALLEVLERDLVYRSWYQTDRTDTHALALRQPSLSPTLRQTLDELRLEPTVLVLPGPANTACVVVCLHTAERGQQSFGARCVVVADDSSLSQGIETATYEALMVRWSMGTSVARRAWRDLCYASPRVLPRGPLEHALLAFHRQDSLGYWLAKVTAGDGWACPLTGEAGGTADWRLLARLLAEHTGEDVVVVSTTTPELRADGVTVVRVVVPGAYRLPADERCAPLPCQPDGRRPPPPHPFG
ncbi:MAG: YcaO-like family protein [Egibacteraceae bacterium]